MLDDDILNLSETARLFGVDPQNVRYYIQKGQLHGVKNGRNWEIKRSDADEFLAKRRQRWTPEQRAQAEQFEEPAPSASANPFNLTRNVAK